MSTASVRRRQSSFEQAASGSMTLLEHLRELRGRLAKACLGILIGFIVGWLLSGRVLGLIQQPYCDIMRNQELKRTHGVLPSDYSCPFIQLHATDTFVLKMQISLWVGLIIAAPIWLYQLWAFIAPGLHRHERRWAYWFAGIATPLFAGGAVLAYVVVAKGLSFLLQFNGPNVTTQLEITSYVDFVTGLMLLFGVAFEFPLIILLLNFSGMVSGRKMLGWWRIAVFLFFLFAAIATPTADPFGMSFLGLALTALYFAAVGAALINDGRRRRRDARAALADDSYAPLDDRSLEEIESDEHLSDPSPVVTATPQVVASPVVVHRNRYDETT